MSPMTTRTWPGRTPSASAARVVSIDSNPWPDADTPTDTTAVPSGLTLIEQASWEVQCPVVMK